MYLTVAVEHNVRLLDEGHERGMAVRDVFRDHRRDMREFRIASAITEADAHLRSLRQNFAGPRHQLVTFLFR